MRLATFNIQNLFHRDKRLMRISRGKCFLDWIKEMDFLMKKDYKTHNDLDRVKELSFLLGFDEAKYPPFVVMRKRGGMLFIRGCYSSKEMMASSLNDWNGWVELQTLPVDLISIENKARVLAEVNPDVLLLQEIEDRASLLEFNNQYLPNFNTVAYEDVLVLQGNDDKGREMAFLSKNGYKIQEVKTYMGEVDEMETPLFEKNLMIYKLTTPSNNHLFLISVHLINSVKGNEEIERIRYLMCI